MTGAVSKQVRVQKLVRLNRLGTAPIGLPPMRGSDAFDLHGRAEEGRLCPEITKCYDPTVRAPDHDTTG